MENEESSDVEDETTNRTSRTTNPGIIYFSRIPEHMSVKKIRQIFSEYGELDRIFLQPDDKKSRASKKNRSFTEVWVEFCDKRDAKHVAMALNNQRIGGKRRSPWYDELWNMKYLKRFQWTHLNERLAYERAVHKQRMRTEVSQVKREMTHFVNGVEKKNILERLKKKRKVTEDVKEEDEKQHGAIAFKQKQTDDNFLAKKKKNEQSKSNKVAAASDKQFLRGLFSGGVTNNG